jgi:hypothetical protein
MMETSRVAQVARCVAMSCWGRSSCTTVCVLVAMAACGCASRGNVELLEAQLRLHERQLRTAQSELKTAHSDLQIARQDSQTLRTQLADRGQSPLLPEQADVLFRAAGIRLNSMLTGGLDRDGEPGDDTLAVALVPHDGDDEPVKLPGEVRFELYDMTHPKNPQQVGAWDFSVEDSHAAWQRGLLGAGYRFQLPLQHPPETPELVLHARLTTSDRRLFDTNTVVNLKPRPDALARVEPTADAASADSQEVIPVKLSVDSEAAKSDDLPPFQDDVASENDASQPIRTSDSWMEADIPTYR